MVITRQKRSGARLDFANPKRSLFYCFNSNKMNATPSSMIKNHFTLAPSTDEQVDSNQVIKKASKSFHFASLLLPERIRPAITDLYAFMRYLDDLIDEDVLTIEQKRSVVDQFCPHLIPKESLRMPYEMNKDIMTKFKTLQFEYGFSNDILMLFVEGLYWDLENKKIYNTQADLIQYCIRVAGTVGMFLCYIMKHKDEYTLYYACCLGIAMQLTNIARDVGEDLGRNRVYLPREWLSESLKNKMTTSANLTIAELSNSDRESFSDATYRLLNLADCYYEVSNIGIDMLPSDCRNAIRTASRVYQEIGLEVRRNNYNSIDHRAYVAFWKKIWLFIQIMFVSYVMFSICRYAALEDINDIAPKRFAAIDKLALDETIRIITASTRNLAGFTSEATLAGKVM